MENNSRTLRQQLCISKWKANNCEGIANWITGSGKTNIGLLAIHGMSMDSNIIIIVPTEVLKEQWLEVTKEYFLWNIEIIIVNTAIKNNYSCDLLIIDEIHVCGAETFRNIFDTISYNYILGLTASIKRADGEEKLILEKAPIIDVVTEEEALANNWISPYDVYVLYVQFTPEERKQYLVADNKVKYCMANFGMTGSYKAIGVRKHLCYNAVNKLQTVQDILNYFKERKTIVFSKSTEFADRLQKVIGDECVLYHSKKSKEFNKEAVKEFSEGTKRVISSVTALNAGVDVPDCSLGIIASGDSTDLTNTQQKGRILRWIEGKRAIIIYLCVENSVEVSWINKKLKGKVTYIKNVNEII